MEEGIHKMSKLRKSFFMKHGAVSFVYTFYSSLCLCHSFGDSGLMMIMMSFFLPVCDITFSFSVYSVYAVPQARINCADTRTAS